MTTRRISCLVLLLSLAFVDDWIDSGVQREAQCLVRKQMALQVLGRSYYGSFSCSIAHEATICYLSSEPVIIGLKMYTPDTTPESLEVSAL